MLELASRDVVSRAEQIEINEGRGNKGCVLLDCRHLGRSFLQDRLGQIYAEAKTFANVDLAEEPLPIRPGMHYQMGGIKTDTEGRCWDVEGQWKGLPGLFAAGETACVSLHGGNRLGANSLLDTVVFGRRAGQYAAEYGKTLPPHSRKRNGGRQTTGCDHIVTGKTGTAGGRLATGNGHHHEPSCVGVS